MLYPVIIHKEPETDYGVIIPDFPGVFSGGSTLEETLRNVQEAVETLYEGEIEMEIPNPSSLESVLTSEDAESGAVVLVDLSFDFLNKTTVPVNITMPSYLRTRIDRAAKERGLTRSGLIQTATREYIERRRGLGDGQTRKNP